MSLPNRIFITGAPGSKWTSVTHLLETIPGANTSDRNDNRHYDHHVFQGHHGAYFGLPHRKYEVECKLDSKYIDSAYAKEGPGKFIKGHDWAYMLDDVKTAFPGDWLVMVMRPDIDCFAWWNQHGGFIPKYPSYETYGNDSNMMAEIITLNDKYLRFGQKQDCPWEYFSPRWIKDNFGYDITDADMSSLNHTHVSETEDYFSKVMVCLIKL